MKNEFENNDYLQVFMLDPESSKEDIKRRYVLVIHTIYVAIHIKSYSITSSVRLEAAQYACASQSKQVLGGLLFTCGKE